jgi:hypothetical protein
MGLFQASVIGNVGPVIPIEYLLVGGGGASQAINNAGSCGGGGAGGFLSGSLDFVVGLTSPYIQVGCGAARVFGATVGDGEGNDGSASVAFGFTALGGGGGGNKTGGSVVFVGSGRAGGSGGGAGASGLTFPITGPFTGSGGTGTAGQGFDGGGSFTFGNTVQGNQVFRGGSGGGAGGAANNAESGVSSTPGITKAWLDGFEYAGGGAAQLNVATNNVSGSGGRTQNNTTIGTEGKNGIVKVRYTGSVQLFQGGQVAISGGYVYHTFLAPAQTAFTGSNGNHTFYYIGE